MGVVVQSLQNRSHTQKRAVSFQAEQQAQVCEVPMIFLTQQLVITKQRFQLQVHPTKQWREKSPGYLIICCDGRHFPVDALMEPSEHDPIDTGLGVSIWASRKLHRVAAGGW